MHVHSTSPYISNVHAGMDFSFGCAGAFWGIREACNHVCMSLFGSSVLLVRSRSRGVTCSITMTLVGDQVRGEIFLDKDTVEAIRSGRVSWYDPEGTTSYRCDGLDPKTFPSERGVKPEVPMKYWSANHQVALKWFARANRTGRAKLPTCLLMASLPHRSFLQHVLDGDIVLHSERHTCGLTKPVSQENYPGLVVDCEEYNDEAAQSMLEFAKSLLSSA